FENDDGKTPIEKKTKLIYVHANIINQLINDSHIKDAGIGLTRLLIAVMIALALLLTWLLRPTYSVIAVFV
ncbi:MAG: hypothetical protein J7639_23645, partial [Paenibacillaceae bacterium]|nr:hypothetical protein [Paenibacillaceae bacterium]